MRRRNGLEREKKPRQMYPMTTTSFIQTKFLMNCRSSIRRLPALFFIVQLCDIPAAHVAASQWGHVA
jgi:hypothetical protein